MLSQYWVTAPSATHKHEAKDSCSLPPIIATLIAEVKTADDLGKFLQNSIQRKSLQDCIAQLTSDYEKKIKTLIESGPELNKILTELESFKDKFYYEGNNPTLNQTYLTPYKNLNLFYIILECLNTETLNYDKDALKIILINLFDAMEKCFGGIHTRATYAWMHLLADTVENQLLVIRQELVKDMALSVLRADPRMKEPGMAGNEIHFVNSILNSFSQSFGLLEITDSLAIPLADQNPYPPNQNSHNWFNLIKKVADTIAPQLNPEIVFKQLVENLAGEISTYNIADEEFYEKVYSLLNRFGIDNDFLITSNILNEAGQLFPKIELHQNIRLTLLRRSASKGYVDFETKAVPLNSTTTLHLTKSVKDNYVRQIFLGGEPPKVLPLSHYLINNLSGYEIALTTVQNTEELNTNLITMSFPTLVKVLDENSIYIYGIQDGKTKLNKLNLPQEILDSLDWSQESIRGSDKLYQTITSQMGHDCLSPFALLAKMTDLAHPDSFLIFFNPMFSSLLPDDGWKNIIEFIFNFPDIALQQRLFFDLNISKLPWISLLHAAILYDKKEIFIQLLTFAKNTMPPTQFNNILMQNYGETLLRFALQNGKLDMVELLLAMIDNPDDKFALLSKPCLMDKKTVYHLAVSNGYDSLLKIFNNHLSNTQRATLLNMTDDKNYSPIIIAIIKKRLAALEILLDGFDYNLHENYLKNFTHYNPILTAASIGDAAFIRVLLKKVLPSHRAALLSNINQMEEAALYIAVKNGHVDAVKALLVGVNVSDRKLLILQKTRDGTPVFMACLHANPAILENLLEGLDNAEKFICLMLPTVYNLTPLYIATEKGHLEVVNKILEGLDVDQRMMLLAATKEGGYTALHSAVAGGHLAIVRKFLLDLTQDLRFTINNMKTEINSTPLSFAVEKGFIEIIEELLKGMTIEQQTFLINQPNSKGASPLKIAVLSGNVKLVEKLLEGLNAEGRLASVKSLIFDSSANLVSLLNTHKIDMFEKLLGLLDPEDRVKALMISRPHKGSHYTPIVIALCHQDLALFKKILSSLTNPQRVELLNQNLSCMIGQPRDTLISSLVKNVDTTFLKILFEFINPNDRRKILNTTSECNDIFLAAREGMVEAIRICVDNTLDLNILSVPCNCTPDNLRKCAAKHQREAAMIDFLNENTPDARGHILITPIQIAKVLGHTAVVKYLETQLSNSHTPAIYAYANELDSAITKAKEKGWLEWVTILSDHKQAVVNQEEKIEQCLIEVTQKLDQLTQGPDFRETTVNIHAHPSTLYGSRYGSNPNENLEKFEFKQEIESQMNIFRHNIHLPSKRHKA